MGVNDSTHLIAFLHRLNNLIGVRSLEQYLMLFTGNSMKHLLSVVLVLLLFIDSEWEDEPALPFALSA